MRSTYIFPIVKSFLNNSYLCSRAICDVPVSNVSNASAEIGSSTFEAQQYTPRECAVGSCRIFIKSKNVILSALVLTSLSF